MNFSSVILRGRQLFHTTYKLYMISLLCEVFYLLITCIAYGKYAEDGRENNGLKVFGKVYIFSSFSPPPLVAKKSCIIKWVNVDYDLATIPKRPNKISQDPNSTRIYPIWCAFFFQFFVVFLGFFLCSFHAPAAPNSAVCVVYFLLPLYLSLTGRSSES